MGTIGTAFGDVEVEVAWGASGTPRHTPNHLRIQPPLLGSRNRQALVVVGDLRRLGPNHSHCQNLHNMSSCSCKILRALEGDAALTAANAQGLHPSNSKQAAHTCAERASQQPREKDASKDLRFCHDS